MIYLIHFEQPLGGQRHQAQHYLGYVDGDEQSVTARLAEHRTGWGARILAACNLKGIQYDVVATFPGDRTRERQMKNWKKIKGHCPICSPQTSRPC